MALYGCPLCGHANARLVHSLAHAPKRHIVDREHALSPLDFSALQVVECERCRHLYNAAFDPDDAEDIYVHTQVTNAPVSPGMVAAVAQTADSILAACPRARRVLEIGGSGALAVAIASRGSEVVMVEPNRHLDVAALARQGVTLLTDMFPSNRVTGKFDLIVCRQVLEHIPHPRAFMDAIDDFLADGGAMYLEVPSADYILEHCSLVDFHLPHVQYYRRRVLTRWLAQRGYVVSSFLAIKDGHDAGYFLARRAASQVPHGSEADRSVEADARSLAGELASARAQGAARLLQASKPIALYGATAYSQAFFGAWPDSGGVDRAFDDTQGYWQSCVYGPRGTVPVVRCDAASLSGVGTVIISAYLHDREILKKLRSQGYEGTVYTLRSKAANPLAGELPSLA